MRECQTGTPQIWFQGKLAAISIIVTVLQNWVSSTMREPVEKVANHYRGEPGVKVNSNPDVDDDGGDDDDAEDGEDCY